MSNAATREQRETELNMMMNDMGRLLTTYMRATKSPPPVGMLASDMIQAILDKEFPPAAK